VEWVTLGLRVRAMNTVPKGMLNYNIRVDQ
jgi:hypothetical protein